MTSIRVAICLFLLINGFSMVSHAHPGIHGEQRIAPDNQTTPLDVGTLPEIPESERMSLRARVVDSSTGQLLPHRVRITDSHGRYYPPTGHTELGELDGHVDNVTLEPDVVNRGNLSWAMIETGTFEVPLRINETYTIHLSHGFEYDQPKITFTSGNKADATLEQTFEMTQGIDMQARGWMSADSHVHSLSPEGALRQMEIEDVDYINLMFIGPEHPLLTRGFVTGKPHPVSTKDRIVYVSQEVRDMEQGHMTLLGMKRPIEPILVYTGTGKREPEPLPNEPLNWQVAQIMRGQNGLAFHAHYLFWPGHGSAVGGALGLLDGLEWTSTDIVNNRRRTMQGLAIPGYEQKPTGLDSGRLYYRMLNCGVRLPLIGGTDKMSAARTVGSVARTYAKVDAWTHDAFMDALRTGNTFVTNGPLLSLTSNGKPLGSDLQLKGKGPFKIHIAVECFSQQPINYVQLVHDGEVVYEIRSSKLPKQNRFEFDLAVDHSGWIALRAGHDTANPEDWWSYTQAAHTSPIYLTVNGEQPANADDARYLLARLDTTLQWAETGAIWSSSKTKWEALDSFKRARSIYEAALNRAKE